MKAATFAAAAVSILLALPTGGAAAFAAANHVDASPLGKVIGLLQGMLEKSKQEKHEEMVQYTKYKLFCDSTEEDKKKAIEEADAQIELLKASIQKFETEVGRLEGEIGGHQEDLHGYEEDLSSAAAQRKVQHADYTTLLQDYTESLQAVEKAIQVLKLQDKKNARCISTSGTCQSEQVHLRCSTACHCGLFGARLRGTRPRVRGCVTSNHCV